MTADWRSQLTPSQILAPPPPIRHLTMQPLGQKIWCYIGFPAKRFCGIPSYYSSGGILQTIFLLGSGVKVIMPSSLPSATACSGNHKWISCMNFYVRMVCMFFHLNWSHKNTTTIVMCCSSLRHFLTIILTPQSNVMQTSALEVEMLLPIHRALSPPRANPRWW